MDGEADDEEDEDDEMEVREVGFPSWVRSYAWKEEKLELLLNQLLDT